jgi:hypothetical protein
MAPEADDAVLDDRGIEFSYGDEPELADGADGWTGRGVVAAPVIVRVLASPVSAWAVTAVSAAVGVGHLVNGDPMAALPFLLATLLGVFLAVSMMVAKRSLAE